MYVDDYRQSEEYAQYFYSKKWYSKKINSEIALIKHFPIFGSIMKLQRCKPSISLEAIDNLAKATQSNLVILEPNIHTSDPNYAELINAMDSSGYKSMNYILSPTKTSYIDLSRSEADILNSFHLDIKKAIRHNQDTKVDYKITTDFNSFYNVLMEFGITRHLFVQNMRDWMRKWLPFKNKVHVLFAYTNGKLLGANMILLNPPDAFGIFLPTTKLGHAAKISASLVWEGLKFSKNMGCTQFDLNGLYDARFNAPLSWLGFSEFKKKFNGVVVEFMPPKAKAYSYFFKYLQKLGLLWLFLVDSN